MEASYKKKTNIKMKCKINSSLSQTFRLNLSQIPRENVCFGQVKMCKKYRFSNNLIQTYDTA